MFEGAAEAHYKKHRDALREMFTMIDAIAKARFEAEQMERDGTIESADERMKDLLDKGADEALSNAKMQHHAELLARGIDDPEAHQDFIAGLFGGFKAKDDAEPKE